VRECEVVAVTSGMEEVTGSEEVEAEKATVKGVIKVVGQEYEGIRGRSIDVEVKWEAEAEGVTEVARVVEQLKEEIEGGDEEAVAYRGKYRWVEGYRRVSDDEQAAEEEEAEDEVVKAGGVYLITGGLGAIGLAVGRWMGKEAGAKLGLISRRGMSGEGEEAEARRRAVRELREMGVEVEVVEADVRDEEAMKAAVEEVERRLGDKGSHPRRGGGWQEPDCGQDQAGGARGDGAEGHRHAGARASVGGQGG
jgi:acyl transferase domain-containing protein